MTPWHEIGKVDGETKRFEAESATELEDYLTMLFVGRTIAKVEMRGMALIIIFEDRKVLGIALAERTDFIAEGELS